MKKFYKSVAVKEERHIENYAKRDSEHTFVIGSFPRKCKCVIANKNHAVFEVKQEGWQSRGKSQPDVIIVPLDQKTLDMGVIMDHNQSQQIMIKGLYKDSTGNVYTKELKKIDEVQDVLVQVGDKFTSNKHRSGFSNSRTFREIEVVYVGGDGSIVVEYTDRGHKKSEMMRPNDQSHTTYPIFVK